MSDAKVYYIHVRTTYMYVLNILTVNHKTVCHLFIVGEMRSKNVHEKGARYQMQLTLPVYAAPAY